MKSIKRYGNRRLYDFNSSRYINYTDLRRAVARGERFEVRDHLTGKIITQTVVSDLITTSPKLLRNDATVGRRLWNTLRAL